MRTSTRRATRFTATLAGTVALGAVLTGTAAAQPADTGGSDQGISDRDVFGPDPGESGSSPSTESRPEVADDNLDGETMSPSVHQPGLVTFDTPTLKTSGLSG